MKSKCVGSENVSLCEIECDLLVRCKCNWGKCE